MTNDPTFRCVSVKDGLCLRLEGRDIPLCELHDAAPPSWPATGVTKSAAIRALLSDAMGTPGDPPAA